MLLPKAISYYRSLRAGPAIHGLSIQPIPPPVYRAILVLSITALSFLLKAILFPSPENIFTLTQSRLQIPIDVLFARLSALRSHGLTPIDELLRSRIESRDSRLLYFHYGPEVLSSCHFCTPDDPNSYLYYTLPSILAPHLLNLCILALATSALFTGPHASPWRPAATMAAAGLALADLYLVASYPHHENAIATRLVDIDMFFWKARIYRAAALAVLDAALAYILYLSSTNRAFVKPPAAAERIALATRSLDAARSKIGVLSALRNAITRDEGLTALSRGYWADYGRLMSEAMEDREVIEGVNNALENRINVASISADADSYIEAVLHPLTVVPIAGGNL